MPGVRDSVAIIEVEEKPCVEFALHLVGELRDGEEVVDDFAWQVIGGEGLGDGEVDVGVGMDEVEESKADFGGRVRVGFDESDLVVNVVEFEDPDWTVHGVCLCGGVQRFMVAEFSIPY